MHGCSNHEYPWFPKPLILIGLRVRNYLWGTIHGVANSQSSGLPETHTITIYGFGNHEYSCFRKPWIFMFSETIIILGLGIHECLDS